MTSTYLPAFFPLRNVPPFLACGCPSRSSILLASLIAVGGLEGGAEEENPSGGARTGVKGNDEASSVLLGSAAADEKLRVGEGGICEEEVEGLVILMGGRFVTEKGGVESRGIAGTGGVVEGGGTKLAALTAREGGPFGGGALGTTTSDPASPAFLLTHFLRSES